MKIKKINTVFVDIPLKRPHKMSMCTMDKSTYVIVILHTDTGLEGLGEAVALGGPTWSEESAESIKVTIDRYLAPLLIGENPEELERLRMKMNKAVRGNPFAKGALEMALFDVVGQHRNVPVYDLLGGLVQEKIPLSWSLASGSIETEIAEAQAKIERGGFIFKMKVGALKAEEDIERLRLVREAVGVKVRLRVDANQGWDRMTAIRAARGMEQFNLDFLEQPVPRWDIDGMAAVAKAVNIPILADESLASEHDAIELVKREAAAVFGLKLTKAGGFLTCKRLAGIAEGAGFKCYVGCMVETGIGTSAYTSLAVSTPSVTLGCELFGPQLLVDDLVKEETIYQDGHILVNHRPGLGVSLDYGKLNKYKQGELTTIG